MSAQTRTPTPSSQEVVDAQVLCLRHPSPRIIKAALRVIGFLGEEGQTAIPNLRTLASHSNGSVRAAVAVTLKRIGRRKGLRILKSLLLDNNARTRMEAVEAIAVCGDEREVDCFTACLDDKDLSVRSSARGALMKVGSPRAAPALKRRALKEPNEYERSQLIEAIGSLGTSRELRFVISCLDEESGRVASAAHHALVQMVERLKISAALANDVVDSLLGILKEKKSRYPEKVCEALSHLAERRHTEKIRKTLLGKGGLPEVHYTSNLYVCQLLVSLGDRHATVRRRLRDLAARNPADRQVQDLLAQFE